MAEFIKNKKRRRPKNNLKGYDEEAEVRNWFYRKGWEVLKLDFRGPAGIIARSKGKLWFVQVKYRRSLEMDFSSFSKELRPLIKLADENHGTAVLCIVIQSSVWFYSAKTNRILVRGFLT